MRNYSIKEAETLVLKASRGAYMTWGLAEEAARAVGWLLHSGISGQNTLETLVMLLNDNDGKSCHELGPVDPELPWISAFNLLLCPIVTGALLSDSAKHVLPGEKVHAGPMAYPALFLPFAAALSKVHAMPVRICWTGFEALCTTDGVEIIRGSNELFTEEAKIVTVEINTHQPASCLTTQNRVNVDDTVRVRLEQYAHRTYVPETEESRLSGAGGGTVDGD